jgi:hypothetical protein
MDRQEPLGRKAADICPPVSEWDIQDKNKDGNDDKLSHGDPSKILNYSGIAGMFQYCRL